MDRARDLKLLVHSDLAIRTQVDDGDDALLGDLNHSRFFELRRPLFARKTDSVGTNGRAGACITLLVLPLRSTYHTLVPR